jgi:hypothetical protein
MAPDGALIGVVGTGSCGMTSVDRFDDGTIVATGFCGRVFVTNESLRTPSTFYADAYGGYVTAVPLSLGNHAPDCAAVVADVSELWPPNHQLVPVRLSGVVDPDGDDVSLRATAVTQDEPLLGEDGDGCPDAAIDASGVAWIRVERAGAGNGRVYRLAYDATDSYGAVCSGAANVCIPHSQGALRRERRMIAEPACEDDGQRYVSTGPCPTGPASLSQPVLQVKGTRDPILIYDIRKDGDIELSIFDVAGRRVATLATGPRAAGRHTVAVGASVPPGVFFSRLRVGAETVTRTVVKTR